VQNGKASTAVAGLTASIQVAIDANNSAVALGSREDGWKRLQLTKAVQYDPRNQAIQSEIIGSPYGFRPTAPGQKDFSGAEHVRKALSAAPDNGLAGKDAG